MADNALNKIYANIVTAIVDNVPDIKTVDIDLGQLKKGGENIPLTEPAVLIKIENVSWRPFDSSKKIGDVHVRLKVIYPFTNDDENYTTFHFVRTEVDYLYQLIHSINEAVENIFPSYHSMIERFNEHHLQSIPEEMKWIYCLDYQCNIFSDNSTFGDGSAFTPDYDALEKDNWFLERTIDAEKVG